MSRQKSIVTMVLVAALGLGLWVATGPLGLALAGTIGLAVTFGFYWKSLEGVLTPKAVEDPIISSQPDPDADAPKHWGWRAVSGLFAAVLILLGFALAA
jgi:hypothetical protein